MGATATPSSSPYRFRTIAATAVIAAVLGGLAGSLATTGINYFVAAHAPPPPPVKTAGVNEALGRINRELTALKAGLDSSAKSTNQQVAKIADRMDRAEKAQTDAGTKLAKASETLDRIERRSSAVPAASASTDITGAIGDMNVASATPSEPRQPSSLLTVDGWVLRGVYNGAAMIQGRHVGVVEVISRRRAAGTWPHRADQAAGRPLGRRDEPRPHRLALRRNPHSDISARAGARRDCGLPAWQPRTRPIRAGRPAGSWAKLPLKETSRSLSCPSLRDCRFSLPG